MTALASRYHMIRYGLRGSGRSTRPDAPFPRIADLGAMLDRAGARQAPLVGSSVSGATAIGYTLTHPGWVTAPVEVASGISGDLPW